MGEKVKKYVLAKHIQMPGHYVPVGTPGVYEGRCLNFKGHVFDQKFIDEHPDWFEEVVDDPFKIEWVHFNRSYENGWQFMFQSSHCLTPNKFQDKIKKAIEDIVNGVDENPLYRGEDGAGEFHWAAPKPEAIYYGRPKEKYAVGVDQHAKIYSAAEANQLQTEAFKAGCDHEKSKIKKETIPWFHRIFGGTDGFE